MIFTTIFHAWPSCLVPTKFFKPLRYKSFYQDDLRAWGKGRFYFLRTFLRFYSLFWVLIPLCAFCLYILGYWDIGVGKVLSDTNLKFFNKFIELTTPTQASLVGIIIPVIFALVEQLFRNQDTFFKAFLYWSKVIVLILSSLAFVGFLLLQASFPVTATSPLFIVSFLWLVLNLIGTAILILVSVGFFFPETRFKLIKKYVGQVLLPLEIQSNLDGMVRTKHQNSDLFLNGVFQNLFDKAFFVKQERPTTQEILHHLSLPVIEAIQKRAHEEFKRQFRYLIDVHVFLILESRTYNDRDINYSLLPRNPWWGFEQFREWNDPYRQIISECVNKISDDEQFFHTCCHYWVSHMYGRLVPNVPVKITDSTINWATFVFSSLSSHVNKIAISSLNSNLQVGEEVPLPAYLHNLYDPELKRFISSWEDLRQTIFRYLIKENEAQIDQDRIKDLSAHLKETIFMICRSVSNGDRHGSEWLVDSFLRWNDSSLRLDRPRRGFGLDRDFTGNLNQFDAGCKAIDGLDVSDEEKIEQKKKLVSEGLKSFWFDISIAGFGVLWAFAKKTDSALARDIAAQIYDQTIIDASSCLIPTNMGMGKANSVLESYIRMITDRGYSSSVSEGLSRGFESPMSDGKVLGRVYTTWGGSYTYETYAYLLILLVIKKDGKPILRDFYIDPMVDYVLQDGERFESFIASYSSMDTHLRAVTLDDIRLLGAQFGGIDNDKAEFYKRRAFTIMKLSKRYFDKKYYERIAAVPISGNLIAEKRASYEEVFFSDIENQFPISLFQTCSFVSDYLPNNIEQAFKDCPRELFVESDNTLRKDPWPNDDIYHREYTPRIRFLPLYTALQSLNKTEFKPTSATDFWNELTSKIDLIRGSGKTPIIIGGRTPEFIFNWEHHRYDASLSEPPASFSKECNEEYDQQYGKNYMRHLYDTPAFNPFFSDVAQESYLVLAKEDLQAVQFRRYADDTIIELTYVPYDDRPHLGKISVKWDYNVIVGDGDVYEISWSGITQDD